MATSRRGRNILRRAPPQGTPVTVPKRLEAQHIRFMRQHANLAIAISVEELGSTQAITAAIEAGAAEARRDSVATIPQSWDRFDASRRFRPLQSIRALVNQMRDAYRARFNLDAAIDDVAEMQGKLDRSNARRWSANAVTQIAQDPQIPTPVGPAVVATHPQVSERTRASWVRRNVEAVALAAVGAAALLFFRRSKTIPEEYFDRVEADLTQGARKAASDAAKAARAAEKAGESASEAAARAVDKAARETRDVLADEPGIARRRAKIIGRDQTEKFNGKATEERNRAVGVLRYRWNTQGDARVRAAHRARNGKIFSWNKPPPDGHPGEPVECFPADTPVQIDGLRAVTRRMWRGELAEVVTSSGRRIRATPNHPVLTTRGWVGLGSLDSGDHIVEVVPDGPSVHDDDQRESSIGDLFESVRVQSSLSKLARGGEFHGDASDEEVHIVLVDGELGSDSKTGSASSLCQRSNAGTTLSRPSKRQLYECLVGSFRPTDSVVGSLDGECSLAIGHASPSSPHRIGPTSDGSVAFAQGCPDSEPVAPVFLGKGEFGDSRLVFRAHRVDSVTLKEWSGHVFNAETKSGWYQAQGLAVSNCRCWASGDFRTAFKTGTLVAKTRDPTPIRPGRRGPIRPADLPAGVDPGQIAFQREVFETPRNPSQVAQEERDRRRLVRRRRVTPTGRTVGPSRSRPRP